MATEVAFKLNKMAKGLHLSLFITQDHSPVPSNFSKTIATRSYFYFVYFLLPLPFFLYEQSFHLENTEENMEALFLEELVPEKKW